MALRNSTSRFTSGTALSLLMLVGIAAAPAFAQTATQAAEEDGESLGTIILSAEDQIKQALGASTVTSEDMQKTPVVNDISEIVRKMPGVNLTGNTPSGQRGNNRQIDIRGMGPENTLILIDGKPVLSRNSVRMGRQGERDTRGDSNWVAPELIERIEVIRGPAAARYGSGAAGGVVNIVTKNPEEATGQVSLHYNRPQNSDEGDSKRINLMYATPLGANLHARLNLNWNDTAPDAYDINREAALAAGLAEGSVPAGREGVVNKDIGLLLSWAVAEGHKLDFQAGFSRQGNRYAGDTQNSSGRDSEHIKALYDTETNTMYRRTLSVTHTGEYDFGRSFSYLQYEGTRNSRLGEGTAGRVEGQITADAVRSTNALETYSGKTEWVLPGVIGGVEQSLTFGADFRYESLKDSTSNTLLVDGVIPGTDSDPSSRDPKTKQVTVGFYVESNIQWDDKLTLTPALRIDHADTFGVNVSPSLNATYQVTDNWQIKGGVARALKTPNLYQLNPNYVYSSSGNGCLRIDGVRKPCWIVGNPDLKPETSVNAELGVAYDSLSGTTATLTAFHNDFHDYIMGGVTEVGRFEPEDGGDAERYYKWENIPKAKISGLEGSFATELSDAVSLAINATYMISSKNETTGEALSFVPRYTVNASVDWRVNEQLTITPSASFYGKTKSRTTTWNTGLDVEEADIQDRGAYATANLNARYAFDNGAVLVGGISNLFDEKLERTGKGANTFNEPGRAFYIGLTKSF